MTHAIELTESMTEMSEQDLGIMYNPIDHTIIVTGSNQLFTSWSVWRGTPEEGDSFEKIFDMPTICATGRLASCTVAISHKQQILGVCIERYIGRQFNNGTNTCCTMPFFDKSAKFSFEFCEINLQTLTMTNWVADFKKETVKLGWVSQHTDYGWVVEMIDYQETHRRFYLVTPEDTQFLTYHIAEPEVFCPSVIDCYRNKIYIFNFNATMDIFDLSSLEKGWIQLNDSPLVKKKIIRVDCRPKEIFVLENENENGATSRSRLILDEEKRVVYFRDTVEMNIRMPYESARPVTQWIELDGRLFKVSRKRNPKQYLLSVSKPVVQVESEDEDEDCMREEIV